MIDRSKGGVADGVPDLKVEKLSLGELSDEEAAAVREALDESDGAAEDRLTELKHDDAEILRRLPPSQVSAEVQRRLAATAGGASVPAFGARRSKASLDDDGGRRGGWFVPSLALAAAGLLLWVVVRPGDGGSSTPGMDEAESRGADAGAAEGGEAEAGAADAGADTVRLKGDTRLLIERLGEGAPQLLRDGAAAEAGDRVQLSYIADGAPFGVIVSIDGAGGATLHFPNEPSDSPRLGKGRVSLGHSFELDDAPAYERFFFVTAPDDDGLVDAVMTAAQSLASGAGAEDGMLPLPGALKAQQRVVLLAK